MTDFPALRYLLQAVENSVCLADLDVSGSQLESAWAEWEQAKAARRGIVELEAHICDLEDALKEIWADADEAVRESKSSLVVATASIYRDIARAAL